MKNAHIRVLVILAIVTLVGIISTQLHWLNRAIEQQDQVFTHNVHLALRNVVESLCEARGKDYPTVNPIEQISANYFIVRTNDQIDIANLEYLITAEIRKRAITQDFDYGVYDCQNDQMVFAENVNIGHTRSSNTLPTLDDQDYYFGVHFPEKSQSIIGSLDLWKFTTALTFIVILFFGYAVFVILKQKRLSEIQKDFMNNVTHELKTPLSTLALASDTLMNKTDDSLKKYVKIIQSEVNKLKSNVEQILDTSLTENRQHFELEVLDIQEMVHALLEEYKLHYASQLIDWQIKGTIQNTVQTNPPIVERAIRNVVENAIKYGGRKIEIDLSQNTHHTTIQISDDGKGIPGKFHAKVFDKFYRVPEECDQHNVKGFGLGLYLVRSSLKKVGGLIEVSPNSENGASFLISIPNG